MKYIIATIFAAVVVMATAATGTAGLYHTGGTLLCYDCHTMHYSMQHGFGGGTVGTSPAIGGNWLGTTGPNQFLLKAPANQLCLACHDGQTFAPDVLGTNINPSPTEGREAGALNDSAGTAPYEAWKGHTLDATGTPPGFNPVAVGALAGWYTGPLECTSCHAQHGPATAYRNLGPYSLYTTGSGIATAGRPTFVLSATNDTTKDVWINLASYTAGSGAAATFNPVFDRANINFNRNDATVGTTKTSNGIDTFCGACHGDFHGGPQDTNIGATTAALDGFIRHPTSQVVIGAAGTQGFGGHSSLSRFQANTTKVKVYSDTFQSAPGGGFTDASPGCITCHKGHGNQNPFGLVFLNRNTTSVGEEGGIGTGQTADTPTGFRNLCGQCHGQGN